MTDTPAPAPAPITALDAIDSLTPTLPANKPVAFYWDPVRKLTVCNIADKVAGEGLTCNAAMTAAVNKWNAVPRIGGK